eukprot:2518020-Pyramimonas_sp.AAC.1
MLTTHAYACSEGPRWPPPGPSLRKATAHVDAAALTPGSDQWRHAKCNGAADRMAKVAAARAPQPGQHEAEAAEKQA